MFPLRNKRFHLGGKLSDILGNPGKTHMHLLGTSSKRRIKYLESFKCILRPEIEIRVLNMLHKLCYLLPFHGHLPEISLGFGKTSRLGGQNIGQQFSTVRRHHTHHEPCIVCGHRQY